MRTRFPKAGAFILTTALLAGLSACDSGPTDVQSGGVRFVLSDASDVSPASTIDAAVLDGSASVSGPALSHQKDKKDRKDKDEWDPRLPRFTSANLTFSSILARNFEGVLVDVAMELPAVVDIIRMEDGRDVTLPDGELPPGTYDQLVVVMTAFQGTTEGGTTITIEPPGGGWTAIVPICPFDVEDGEMEVVGLQLAVKRSFSWENGQTRFDPEFKCDEPEVEPVDG